MLDSLSCLFTSISFLTTSCSFTLFCVPSVILDSLSCLFTSISFLTTSCSFTLIKSLSVMLDSLSCLFTSISFLTTSCSFTLINSLSVMLDSLSCLFTSISFHTDWPCCCSVHVYVSVWFYWEVTILIQVFYCLFISVLVLEIQLSIREGLIYPINLFNSDTFLCLS